MVVRAKFDVIIADCILEGVIELPENKDYKGWNFEDMELPQTFTSLSFFTEQNVQSFFRLDLNDLMAINDAQRSLPKRLINGLYIKVMAIRFYNSGQNQCQNICRF